jgi:hypothetical protein
MPDLSERIYRWLLRLYPQRFRQEYSEPMLQLFRDRLRNERSAFERIRLWLGVICDLVLSIPREHLRRPATLNLTPNTDQDLLAESGVAYLLLAVMFLIGAFAAPGADVGVLLYATLMACLGLLVALVWTVAKGGIGPSSGDGVPPPRISVWVWVWIIVVSILRDRIHQLWPANIWFSCLLIAAFGLSLAHGGWKRRDSYNLWLGIYLLGLSIVVYWLPGNHGLETAWSAIGLGGGFGIVGLLRMRRFIKSH